jgi:hypothetical protein
MARSRAPLLIKILRKRRLRVRLAAHLERERADLRIGESLRLKLRERKTTLQQTSRDDELRAELRLVIGARTLLEFGRFRDDVQAGLRQKGLDLDDRLRGRLAVQFDGGVRAAVYEMADRIGLERGITKMPDLAESACECREIDLFGSTLKVGVEEAELSLIDARRADEAMLCEARRRDARDRRPARVEALGPGALFQEDLNPGGRAAGDALCCGQLLRIELQQFSCGDSRCKVGNETGRVKADVVKSAFDGGADANRGPRRRCAQVSTVDCTASCGL